MRKTIITAFAALTVAGAIASPAAAADATAPSVTVSTADLDLSSSAGRETLESRIDAAVNNVCRRPDVRDLRANMAWEECKAEARSSALTETAFARPFAGVELASWF
ncbi:conserved hypothetical protein [Altererythrobacter sp. B11]|uniref:UrcA family protein n=1 Tax=Altererythrobacter sp. B11 TaxID=2060312 RepID=UPI000DC728AF|nr:UrcA family protein [Altererythrobacter sp. B11]BBC71141.1 conserved hypothetical protein [Altererythrobacter sp. B11]